MNSILNALQEGRLIELPELGKEKALEVLSILVEAVPGMGGFDLVSEVMRREAEFNTNLGHGVACPHARIPGDGPLLCAVGWSPAGIAYSTSGAERVHLIVLYCIPEGRKSSYLKEVSNLARAVVSSGGIQPFEHITDLQEVRARLLDWVEMTIEGAHADSRARMIKLEQRSTQVAPVSEEARIAVHSVSYLLLEDGRYFVLGEDEGVVRALEERSDAVALVRSHAVFQSGGYEVHVLQRRNLAENRSVYDCVAVRSVPAQG